MPDKENAAERQFRYGQRAMMLALLVVVAAGGTGVATAFWPDSVQARVLGVAVPVLTALAVTGLSSLRRRGLGDGARGTPAALDDEWTRMHMERAQRLAFVVVLVAQLPIGILMARLPTTRALLGMGVLTVTLGIGTLIGCYLFLTRERGDG